MKGFYANHEIIVGGDGKALEVWENGKKKFGLNDKVKVTADSNGFICPGIYHQGYGKIIEISNQYTDHYFGVKMENGEFGFLRYCRLELA